MTIADRAPELGIRLDGTPLSGARRRDARAAAAPHRPRRREHARQGARGRAVRGHPRAPGARGREDRARARAARRSVARGRDAGRTGSRTSRSRRTSSWSPPVRPPGRSTTARPDGERILTWTQLYDLDALPKRLIVVGSGVTGAEFAGAYTSLGADVVLVSSRDRVLPGEDADAAQLLEDVFKTRGMTVMSQSRAAGARADRRRRRGHARRRPRHRGVARPVRGRLDPDHRRARPGGGRRPAHAVRAHRGGQGVAHQRPRRSTPPAT